MSDSIVAGTGFNHGCDLSSVEGQGLSLFTHGSSTVMDMASMACTKALHPAVPLAVSKQIRHIHFVNGVSLCVRRGVLGH